MLTMRTQPASVRPSLPRPSATRRPSRPGRGRPGPSTWSSVLAPSGHLHQLPEGALLATHLADLGHHLAGRRDHAVVEGERAGRSHERGPSRAAGPRRRPSGRSAAWASVPPIASPSNASAVSQAPAKPSSRATRSSRQPSLMWSPDVPHGSSGSRSSPAPIRRIASVVPSRWLARSRTVHPGHGVGSVRLVVGDALDDRAQALRPGRGRARGSPWTRRTRSTRAS